MKRLALLLLVAAVALLCSAAPAPAGNRLSSTESIDSAGTLTVSFDESGLKKLPSVDYELDATGTAIWDCADGTSAGNQFQARDTVQGVTPDAKGRAAGSLSLPIAPIGGSFCPFTVTLGSISWTSVTLTNLTTARVYALDPAARTFP